MSCVGMFYLKHLLTLILLCGGTINPCKLIVIHSDEAYFNPSVDVAPREFGGGGSSTAP